MKLSQLLRKVANRTATANEFKQARRRSDLLGFSILANDIIIDYLNVNGLTDAFNAVNCPSRVGVRNSIGKLSIV